MKKCSTPPSPQLIRPSVAFLLASSFAFIFCCSPPEEADSLAELDAGSEMKPEESPPDATPMLPVTVDCSEGACPTIAIDNDPYRIGHSCVGGALTPCPVSGNWDPSLETDSDTGTVWLAYTGASFKLAIEGQPASGMGVNNLLLARSDDGGTSFQYVAPIALSERILGPDGASGTSQHEVNSLVQRPDGKWECLWFEYIDPVGAERGEFIYSRKVADTPEELEYATIERYGGAVLPSQLGTPTHQFDRFPELADCGILTEPAFLKMPSGELYFASNCIALNDAGTGVDASKFRIELLKREGETFSYVGTLLDHNDAVELGGEELTQADLTLSRDGRVLLISTISSAAATPHQGCYVFEISDVASAKVKRDENERAVWSHHIISDGGHLGAGLCTYDAASATGVVISRFEQEEGGLHGYLQASQVHP